MIITRSAHLQIPDFLRRSRGDVIRVSYAALVLAVGAVSSLRAAQAPPHHISAANLSVIQNDTGNTADSVTVTATLSINDMRVRVGSNRGDYNLQVGDTATNDLAEGMILVAISQNGRDNGELPDEQKNYAAPAFDGGASGYWAVIQDLTSDRAEFNINCAVAYFRYSDWFCGWALSNPPGGNNVTNSLFRGSPGLLLGTHFKGISSGRSRVDLRQFGIFSTNSFPTNTGVLLVNHAKNEGNYSSAQINADGTWEVYVKDNFANRTSLEQDPTSFVFIPKANTTVISGRFGLDATGTNAVTLLYSGTTPAFSVTNFAVGRYRLTVPGGSPKAGVLIVSSDVSGTAATNFDNTVSYEPDGDGWIIEHRDVGTFPPPLEACTNEAVASFVYIPASTAGFSIAPTNSLVTSEFGLTASLNVQLDLAPTNDVTINVSSSNPAEGIVSPGLLTFNSTNWNVPQTVTVTGQDDSVADGPVGYKVILAPAISGDTNYNGLKPADVQVVNMDDDQPGITVSPTNGLFTTESGGMAVFSMFLNRQPTADVTIGFSSSNLSEGTVSPASLTFASTNWNTPQTVTVTGVDDFRQDGDIAYKILTAPAVSSDPGYNGVQAPNVAVVNVDNDVPGLVWNYTLPLLVAEGRTTNYTVALTTQPDSNVVIQITVSDTNIATVAPATLTFTPLNWKTPQTVTVSGGDNLVPGDSTNFNVLNTLSSTDPLYANFVGTKTLQAIRLDNETSLTLPSGDCHYGLGMPAIGIDGQARLEDVDATSFDGSVVAVVLTTNANAADLLAIRNAGTNAGQIGVSGAEVSYEGNSIGSFTGGTSLKPLVINLNSNSTLPAVQQLLRSVTFVTPTNGASRATRSVSFTLSDSLGGSASVGKTIHVGAVRLTQYQEGGDYGYGEYHGAADIALSQVGHSTPWPAGRTPAPSEGLLIDWPDGGTPNESQVLLRFDDFVGTNYWQLPSNAIVVSAELLLRINNTGDGGRFFRMLMPWDATNDTWDTLINGIQTDDMEARSMYESQLGVEDGSGATGVGIVSVGVTPDVQAWVNGQTNFGWVMMGWPLRTDGTGFSPSEVSTVGDRPRLRVLWLEPGYATASFRQGVNGYTNTHDTNLRQATPDTAYYTDLTLWSDAADASNGFTNNNQSLLQFGNIAGPETNQIPPGSTIHAAVLDLASVASDSMGDGGRFFAMLQPWDETTATWNVFGSGIQPNGVVAASAPTVLAGNSTLDPDVQGTVNSLDVTTDVQDWVNGTRPNYGWAMIPWPGGSNGWGNRSSKYDSLVDALDPARDRPRLRVYYTAPSGVVASPARLKAPIVASNQVEVRFSGTAGLAYRILRAATVDGTYSEIGIATVDANGNATYLDSAPLPGAAYYRVVYR